MKQGFYLYCIVPARPAGPAPNGAGAGGPGLAQAARELKFIPAGDIQALVEAVPLEEFWGENLKKNLADINWVGSKVLRHNQVIGEAAQRWTAIPMKFGTVFESEESLQKVLREKRDGFRKLFSVLDGKEEWGVKVFCDINKLREHIIQTSENIRDIDAAMKDKSEGAAYFLKRKREGLISEESEKKMNEDATAIHEGLVKFADRNCLNKLQPKELTKKEGEMIINGAYLILKEKIEEFKSKATDLQSSYVDSGLELEISGPWPPYSFASLEGK